MVFFLSLKKINEIRLKIINFFVKKKKKKWLYNEKKKKNETDEWKLNKPCFRNVK